MIDQRFHVLAMVLTLWFSQACQDGVAGPPRAGAPEVIEASVGQAVLPQVRAARARADGEGRVLVVYVSAAWCEPCKTFDAALRSGRLDPYLRGLRFLKFDQDRDAGALAAAGYQGTYIPRFVLPDPDGRGSSRRFEGVRSNAVDPVAAIGTQLQQLVGYVKIR